MQCWLSSWHRALMLSSLQLSNHSSSKRHVYILIVGPRLLSHYHPIIYSLISVLCKLVLSSSSCLFYTLPVPCLLALWLINLWVLPYNFSTIYDLSLLSACFAGLQVVHCVWNDAVRLWILLCWACRIYCNPVSYSTRLQIRMSRASRQVILLIYRRLWITCVALVVLGFAGSFALVPLYADLLTIAKCVLT